MEYRRRLQEVNVDRALARGKSVLLLGPRQTGKTTMLDRIRRDFYVSLVRPDIRQRYERDPGLLAGEAGALKPADNKDLPVIFIDEVQKVPKLLDVIQDLIDRQRASFILTGSSARKLKRGLATNLLPGRIVALRLDPFVLAEMPAANLEERLLYGALPGMIGVPEQDREVDLASYVTTYLEEEVRAEAVVRNLGAFSRFLELAAAESGQIVNARKLSQEIGVAHTTVAGYYDILEDCLVAERVEPLTQSRTRKKLTRSAKYLFFDLGVRRLAAREGIQPPRETWGLWFEQFVGLELLRSLRARLSRGRLRFWRDPDGPEVDWVVEEEGRLLPIEVKWTDTPQAADARHLETFLREYPQASHGVVVCRCSRRVRLSERVTALPWQDTDELMAL